MGVLISIYLLYSTSLIDKVVGSILVLLGIPVCLYFSRTRASELKGRFFSEEDIFTTNLEKQNRFLANFVRMVRTIYGRVERRQRRRGAGKRE
jgi:hypothetical protein